MPAATDQLPNGFRPVRVEEIELAGPLPELSDGDGRYARALAVVLLHGVPLGQVEVDLEGGTVRAGELAALVWKELAGLIDEHLRGDGLAPVSTLSETGLAHDGEPACTRGRRAFLAEEAPPVDVVVPSRDRPERLARCLRAILACDYAPGRRRVIVVDNAPATGATRELVENEFRTDVTYLREDAPGSASARNAGVAASTAPIVAFTDDDVVVDRWWLEEIARTYATVPAAAAVTGLLLPLEIETPAQAWFEEYGGFSRGYEQRLYNLSDHRLDHPLYPFNAGVFGTGNSLSFRRDALDELGLFDPALGNGTPARGGVDTEILLRTVLAGHTIVYQPTALAYHAHRRDYASLRRQLESYGIGLTATFTKTLVTQPRVIPSFLRRLPAGLAFALDPRSPKNARKRTTYPRELTRAELRGMVYGPVAYVRSRRAQRRLPYA